MKKYLKLLAIAILSVCFFACDGEDDLNSESIIIDEPALDPSSETYAFDSWLRKEYLEKYNLKFIYRMQDAGSNTDYNLVPAKLEKSQEMAILVKYLWFDVYSEGKIFINEEPAFEGDTLKADPDFLKLHGPRIIHLIGSAAYNPQNNTKVLGTAEAGIKVTLYDCNKFEPLDIQANNDGYFHTMHHEFMHILHQKIRYPMKYELLSQGYYSPGDWQSKKIQQVAPYGFVSPYASMQPREDFVEVIAHWITQSDDWWQALYRSTTIFTEGMVVPAFKGEDVIKEKIEICRDWLRESWGIDMDALRDEVRERQLHIEEVMAEEYW